MTSTPRVSGCSIDWSPQSTLCWWLGALWRSFGPARSWAANGTDNASGGRALEQDFNSLDAQYDACQAYIRSQVHAGWTLLRTKYDDEGFPGGNADRPALQHLLEDVRTGKVDVVVVYKVDRLTRSLADFAKLVERLDAHDVSFISVTQHFNTTTSMGRLTLNVLLSLAQFEREVRKRRSAWWSERDSNRQYDFRPKRFPNYH